MVKYMTKSKNIDSKTTHTNRRIVKKIKTRKNRDKDNVIHKLLPIKPNYEEKTLCCAIRFYDNFDEMIKQFQKAKKYIESIHVSCKPNKEVMRSDSNAALYTEKFLKLYPDNKFAKSLLETKNKEIGTNIGFSRNDAKNLSKWVLNPQIKTKIVIFDWDGTLSIIEGVVLPPTRETTTEMLKRGITYKEIAEYYAGTKERLTGFQNMFNFLEQKGVEVFILTNNPVAACDWKKLKDPGIGDFSRHNFYMVAKQFIPQIKLANILCGYETNGFKPDTFNNNKYLREMYARIEHWHYTNDASSV